MTSREKALVQYALGFYFTGDGRRAHTGTATKVAAKDAIEVREVVTEWRYANHKRESAA